MKKLNMFGEKKIVFVKAVDSEEEGESFVFSLKKNENGLPVYAGEEIYSFSVTD